MKVLTTVLLIIRLEAQPFYPKALHSTVLSYKLHSPFGNVACELQERRM